MATRYHVQHIGSPIRPKALIDAVKPLRAAVDRNHEGTPEQQSHIQEVTENCIRDVVSEQIERGIRPITSGEFQRIAYINGLFESLKGFERRFLRFDSGVGRPHNPFNGFAIAAVLEGREAMVAVDKIARGERSPYLEEWRFLRTCLPEDQWQQTLEKPYTDDSGYKGDESYLDDVVAALHGEILDLYDEGLRNVQVDDPLLAWSYVDEVPQMLRKEGFDVDRLMDLCMMAHSKLTSDLPSDLNIGHHMCRGNLPGDDDRITVSGGYEGLAARLFEETNYKQYLLEHVSSEKHGGLDFLKHLGRDQVVVLGLVTTKFEELEDVQQLKERVIAAADVIAKGQGRNVEGVRREIVAVSPQCGFASSMDLAGMTIERQCEKLKLL